MWLNKNVASIISTLNILDITSLIFIYFLINLDLEQLLSTQKCFSLYVVHKNGPQQTKMDRSGLNGLQWTQMDRIGPNRTKWTEWTEQHQIGTMWTELDHIGPKWTEQNKVDQCVPKRIEGDRIRTNGHIRTKVDIMD